MVLSRRWFVASRLTQLTFERLGTLLLFVAIAVAACFSPAQNDTWWHLRAGQDIWETGGVNLSDTYSHTVTGAYWPNHEWLSQVLFFSVYHLGGLPLLTTLAAALIVGSWLLAWRLMPGDTRVRLTLCAAALIPSSLAWSLRPQLFTLLLLAATGVLLVRRRYAWLPPVFLMWANLHGGVLLGFALLAAGNVALAFEGRKWPVRLLAVTGLCFLATTITPLGASLWYEVPATLARTRPYGIAEWRAPGLVEPVFIPFWLLTAGLAWLVASQKVWRSTTLRASTPVWAAVAMLPLAIGSGRNVPPFLLVAVPAVAALLDSRRQSALRAEPVAERPFLHLGILVFFAVVGLAGVGYAWSSEIPRLAWHPMPQTAIDAIASCPGRLYNRYDEGGYIIWFLPERKVFLDSRQDPYPAALVHEQIRAEMSGEYQPLFERYAIRCAFVATDSPIARRLALDGWKQVYKASPWEVLVRPHH